jgi:hypothetical protein
LRRVSTRRMRQAFRGKLRGARPDS